MSPVNRREKQLRKLFDAERELRKTTLARLLDVSAGHDTMFFFTSSRWSSPNGAEILRKAHELRRCAEALGEQTPLATDIINAFQHANDESDHQRLGPIRLAETLLRRIENNS